MMEQRSHARLLTRVKVLARMESTSNPCFPKGKEIDCETRDLSLKGFCLSSDEPIPERSRLILNVELRAGEGYFNHLVEVIWCRHAEGKYLTGVQITEHLCDEKAWQEGVIEILIG